MYVWTVNIKTAALKQYEHPVFMLRLKVATLDESKKYILYCDSGRRSSAAAFLLTERGIDAYCLKDGLVARGGD